MAQISVWKPLTLEHANVESEGPITFETKQDLKNYGKKHGLVFGAIDT